MPDATLPADGDAAMADEESKNSRSQRKKKAPKRMDDEKHDEKEVIHGAGNTEDMYETVETDPEIEAVVYKLDRDNLASNALAHVSSLLGHR